MIKSFLLYPREKKPEGRCIYIYNGSSMKPTFHTGQLLYVQPEMQDLVPGDVIIYSDLSHNYLVVHRIIGVSPPSVATRGDHNLLSDEYPVLFGDIVGRVVAVDRRGVIRNVSGGQRGLRNARMRWMGLCFWAKVRQGLVLPYRVLKESAGKHGWVKRIIKLRFKYITLRTTQGMVIKALHRGRVVAHWKQSIPSFECRKPYDLWLGESDLQAIWNEKNAQDNYVLTNT
jgi:signal peptidase I